MRNAPRAVFVSPRASISARYSPPRSQLWMSRTSIETTCFEPGERIVVEVLGRVLATLPREEEPPQ